MNMPLMMDLQNLINTHGAEAVGDELRRWAMEHASQWELTDAECNMLARDAEACCDDRLDAVEYHDLLHGSEFPWETKREAANLVSEYEEDTE